MAAAVLVLFIILLPVVLHSAEYHIPAPVATVQGQDFSVWEQVCEPGFGNINNIAVIAMAEYQGRLYALTRNDAAGVEVWRTSGTSWEQISFPGGIKNGIYGNTWINNHMGAIVVFKGKLYCGFSSGIQGSFLKSSGCEIWRYDGTNWEAVISDRKDREESGTITAISGCGDKDGETTAQITDAAKAWAVNQWAGGVLQITSGNGKSRRFDIISNTADTLKIQQNEIAGERGTEFTVCDTKHYVNPFPLHEYDLGTVQAGDSYEIGTGFDENGFGDYWNKVLPKLIVFENKLYASTALNYENGGQVWYTADGDHWTVTQPSRSLGLFHTDPNYIDSKKPVTRGVPALGVCNVSGSDVLYAGSLGSEGNLGSCARFARLTEKGWELIVDSSVDDNETGTNENGFGGGMACTMFNGNFNVWTIECFNNELFVGFQSLGGTRVLYSPTGSAEDGSWFFSAGGDSGIPNGFDGVVNEGTIKTMYPDKIYQNIAINLFPFNNYLYAGLISLYMPAYGATEEYLTGSQIWKTGDGRTWQTVTKNGFEDKKVLTFEAFAVFNNSLHVAGSRASNTVGGGLGGAKIYRLAPGAACAVQRASIRYNLKRPDKDVVFISGTIKPGTVADPLSENVTVTVQAATGEIIFIDTLPAGSFRKLGFSGENYYFLKPWGGNSKIDVMSIDLATSRFFLAAANENLTRLPAETGAAADIAIAVDIGNDCGAASNSFAVTKDAQTGVPRQLTFSAQ